MNGRNNGRITDQGDYSGPPQVNPGPIGRTNKQGKECANETSHLILMPLIITVLLIFLGKVTKSLKTTLKHLDLAQ